MNNEPLFIKHDYHARNDRKLVALILDHKSSGLGIYWAVVEMIYEENGDLEYDDLTIAMVVKDLNEDPVLVRQVVENCIKKYHLFDEKDGKIISNRATKQLYNRQIISAIRSKAGKAGAKAQHLPSKSSALAKQVKANDEQTSGKSSANAKQVKANDEQNSHKRREEKNINTEIDIIPPDEHFSENGINNHNTEFSPGAEFFVPGENGKIDNVEQEIEKNQIQFELLCQRTCTAPEVALKVLHDCHLWYVKNEKYPVGRQAGYAMFETFLQNKKYHPNGSDPEPPKRRKRTMGGSEARIEGLRKWSLGAGGSGA